MPDGDDDDYDPRGGELAAATADERGNRYRIQWDTKFHARQASKVMSAVDARKGARLDSAGGPLDSAVAGDIRAFVPVNARREPSRLRWHFYSNL